MALTLVALLWLTGTFVMAADHQAPQTETPQATAEHHGGGEAALILPDLSQAKFLGTDGRTLLMFGLLVCVGGLLFGYYIHHDIKKQPVHASMAEIGDLIYETCKTYLLQQGKFILILEVFIGAVIVFYYGFLQSLAAERVLIILAFSLVGIAGSYGVAWYGIRINTYANSRTAFASLGASRSRSPASRCRPA